MSAINYRMSPTRPWRFEGFADNDQALGGNGQCNLFACQEWIDGVLCHPNLVLAEHSGFWICPRCGSSYGRDATPPTEYPC